MTNKTEAQKIRETIESVFSESLITTTDMPDFPNVIAKVLVSGKEISPPLAGTHVIQLDHQHTVTVTNSRDPDAPAGTQDLISGSPEAIAHVKMINSGSRE